jgi:hypothetical protein
VAVADHDADRRRRTGGLPADQIQYPTPLASISAYIVPDQQSTVLASYERAMFADLDRALATLPPGDVAVQWDVALVPYHPADQASGTTGDQVRLIDAALGASPGGPREWGVCTECGMGRADREEVPELLDLHREIMAAG